MPYSYYRETPIVIRINKGHPKIITMKQLFDIYSEFKVVLRDREYIDLTNVGKHISYQNIQVKHISKIKHVYDAKNNSKVSIFEKHVIEVLDGDGSWTELKQVLRHKRDVNMVAIQLNSGDYTVVTENHPVILEDGTEIEAGKVQTGMRIKTGNKNVFKNIATEYIDVPSDFAYFIGFILGDGNVGRHKFNQSNYNLLDTDLCINVTQYEGGITIYQKNIVDTKIYKAIQNIVDIEDNLLRKSVKNDGNRISFNNRTLRTIMAKYLGLDYTNSSYTKNVPLNILSWTKTAKEAFIAGLIDSEGTIYQNGKCEIRMKAHAIMNTLQEILISLGIDDSIKRFTGNSFENCYGINFLATVGIQKFSEKLNKIEIGFVDSTYDTNVRDNAVKKIDIFNPDMDIKTAYNLNEEDSEFYFVYDITTESHTFYSGGMTQHNCYATSLSPIIYDGMPWVKNIKVKPVKHFLSLINNSIKYIYSLSTQCVGAIAVPDFLVYAEYFIRKDYGEEWYDNPEHVNLIKQLFQHWIYSVNDKARGNQSLTYSEKIIVDSKPVAIGEFVESYLINNEMEKPVIDTKYTFTLNRETGRLEANRIKGVIKHKTANKIVEYVLANGAKIKATDNHSFFTRNGLKIEEIQRNSNPTNLLIPFNFIKEDENDSYLQVVQTVGKKEATNIKLDERWMYMLGQYLGDGLWDGSSICIATCDDYVNEILVDMFPEFTYNIKKDNSIRFNMGRNITDAIKSVFNTGSHDKILPRDWATKKNILHLIGGYIDSDGFAPSDGYKGFVLTSVNKELLESVQYILAGYGIMSSIKEKNKKGFNDKLFTVYRLTISASGSRILNSYTKFKKVREQNYKDVDSSKLYIDFKGILKDINIDLSKYKTQLKSNSIKYDNCGIEDIKTLVNILNIEDPAKAKELEKFIYALPVKIVEINECEHEEYVYDISVENNENFLTSSNIYAHNSPFTNVSVFDKYWREAMFGEHTNPDFSKCDTENLKRVQRLFVHVLIEQQQDNPFTFPVMTACQLKDAETGEILDKDWLDWIGEISVKNKLMNFYTSDTCDSLSSCLAKNSVITVINETLNITETLTINDFIHKFINVDNTDQTVNISGYKIKAWNILSGTEEIVNIISVLKKINTSKKLITIKTLNNSLTVSPDHKIAVKINGNISEISASELIEMDNTFIFEICEVVNNNFQWNKIVSIDVHFVNAEIEDKNVYCLELDKLHYFAANNIISHNCCRLRNNLGGTQKSEYTNSFGVGGLNIGSHRVVAINLPQIAYIAKYSDKNDKQAFYNILESRIKIAQDILDIHRELLIRLIDNGNLPMYKHGCMDLSKQYSTLGFIGLYECLEILRNGYSFR